MSLLQWDPKRSVNKKTLSNIYVSSTMTGVCILKLLFMLDVRFKNICLHKHCGNKDCRDLADCKTMWCLKRSLNTWKEQTWGNLLLWVWDQQDTVLLGLSRQRHWVRGEKLGICQSGGAGYWEDKHVLQRLSTHFTKIP